MSQSKESQCVVAGIEQAAEPEQTDESGIVQKAVQSEEPRRGERAHTLTEKGMEYQEEKTNGLLLSFDKNL